MARRLLTLQGNPSLEISMRRLVEFLSTFHRTAGPAGTLLIITVLLIQLIAVPGSLGFARLSKLKGNKFSLMVMQFIWIGVCYFAYTISNEMEF